MQPDFPRLNWNKASMRIDDHLSWHQGKANGRMQDIPMENGGLL